MYKNSQGGLVSDISRDFAASPQKNEQYESARVLVIKNAGNTFWLT